MELSNIKGRVMRTLGKELAKKDEDGSLRWEAVLDQLGVDLTMKQEDIISMYSYLLLYEAEYVTYELSV